MAKRRTSARPRPEGSVLPDWMFSLIRPMLRFSWRILFRIRYQGRERIPQSGGLIVASNHQTYIDPFWIAAPISRPVRFLAWDAAFDWPLVGRLIQLLGAWPLQVAGTDPSAIRRTLQWLREGGAVVIFPEGGRGQPDGSMIRFKGGAVRIALEAAVPILPVTINGGHRVWPPGRHLPRLRRIEITYHPLFHVEQRPDEEKSACARRESDRLAAIIESAR